MTNTISSFIAGVQQLEMRVDERASGDVQRLELCVKPLSEMPVHIEARNPGKRMFSAVHPEQLGLLFSRGVSALCSLRGEDIDAGLKSLSKAIAGEGSHARLLAMNKVLEEAVVRSPNSRFWRKAMLLLSTPLHNASCDIGWKMIAIGCMRSIHERAPDERKGALAGDILAGALFHEPPASGIRILSTLQELETDLSVAAIAAYAVAGKGQIASAAYDILLARLKMLEGGRDAANAAIVLSESGQRGMMPPRLVNGFRDIFRVARIELPHPWYLPKPDVGGRPVPRMDEGGIHLSAFRALGAMSSPHALEASIGGMMELAVPYVGQRPWDGGIEGERAVVKAIPEIAKSLAFAMARNGISNPQDLTSYLLSHPRFLEISGMDDARLMRISPVLFEIVLQGAAAGLEDYPIPGAARHGLMKLIAEQNESEDGMRRSLAMTRFCARAHAGVFSPMDPELEDKRRVFLRRIAAGDDVASARELVGKRLQAPALPPRR